MTSRFSPILGAAGLAVLTMTAGPGGAVAESDNDPQIQLMFVQVAADFAADPDSHTLRLVDVNPQTLYFSDRPVRIAGHIMMPAYLEEWEVGKDNFGDDPPNATLSVYEPGQTDNATVVVELLDPVVDGNDLVYHYDLIDGQIPDHGGPTSLFIDWIGPGGGVGVGFHGVGVGARGPGVAGWAGVAVRNCAYGVC